MPKTERSEAERQSDIRRDKTAWMNEQLAERLPGADYVQPGTAAAKDARADNDYPEAKTPRRAKPAVDEK